MTCQERQDQLLLLAFDQLDAKETEELRQHLDGGCPVCAGALAEAQALGAMLPLALKPETPDAKLKDQLMDLVHEDQERQSLKMPVQIMERNHWAKPVAIAAVIAIAVTGMLAYIGPMRHLQAKNVALNTQLDDAKKKTDDAESRAAQAKEAADSAQADAKSANERAKDALAQTAKAQDQLAAEKSLATTASAELAAAKTALDNAKTELASVKQHDDMTQTNAGNATKEVQDLTKTVSSLQEKVQEAQLDESFIKSPGLQLVTLQATEQQPAAAGHILFDPATSRWLFVATGLKNPGAGKTYELWMMADKPIEAGTFNVDASGEGTLLVNVPAGLHITQAAVTDEPAGGRPSPTGRMQLAGSVQHS